MIDGDAANNAISNPLIGRDITHGDEWTSPAPDLKSWTMQHATGDLPHDHVTMLDATVIPDFYELSRKHLTDCEIFGGKLLEIGGSTARSAQNQFQDFDYINLDIWDSSEVPTIVGDITDCGKLIESNSVDFVFSMHVFEHIAEPWKAASEICRILRPGGLAVTVTFWSWRYHPTPIDYWRYSPDCLEFLFKDLTVLEANFDLSCRRTVRQGNWPNKADAVPVDERGGWLESWNVYHIGQKPE